MIHESTVLEIGSPMGFNVILKEGKTAVPAPALNGTLPCLLFVPRDGTLVLWLARLKG